MTASLPIRLAFGLLRVTLRVVAGLAILVAVLAVGTLAVLQTDAGRRNVAGAIRWVASDDTGGIALDGLAVDWDLDLRLASLVVHDADGPYLSVSGLDVEWRPLALLTGLVAIDRVGIERVALARLPVPAPEADAPEPPSPPGLPTLPAVHLDGATVERIELGAAVAGTAMRLSATAALRTEAAPQSLSGEIAVSRIDGTDGSVDARLRFDRDSNVLSVQVAASEPRGGLAARLLQIEGLPAVDFSLTGDGTLDDWKAELALQLDGETDVSGTARLTQTVAASGVPERTLTADLSGRLTPLAPPVAEAFLMGETRVSAQARLSDAFVPLEITLSAASDTLSSDIAASFDAANSALDATVDLRLSAGNDARIALELPDRRVILGDTTLSAAARGPLSALTWRIDLASASVETDEAALETMQVVLSGSDLDGSDPTEEIPATLTATIARLSPKTDAAAGLAGPLRLSGVFTLAPETFTAEIASFETEFAPFALSANGTVGLAEVDADLKLNISDLAHLSPKISGPLTVDAHLEGPLTAPVITADASAIELLLSGKPVRDLQLSARADTNPEALSADLELTATVDGNDLAAALRAEPEGDGLRVPTLSLTAGENTLSGDLAVADLSRATQTLTGSLTIAAPDLSEFSALVLTELSGRLSGQVDLTQEDGRATAHVQLTGTEVSAAGTQVAGLDADLTLRDLFTAPALAGKARATGILTGGTPVEQVDITASGTGDNTEFSLDARLTKGANADGVALAGTLATGNDGLDLLLKTLDGRYRGIRTRLSEPARIVSSPDRHAHRAVFAAPRQRPSHPCRDRGRHA